jgi:hypothetical protein
LAVRCFLIPKRVNIIARGRGKELSIGQEGANWGLKDVLLWRSLDLLFEMHRLDEFFKNCKDKKKVTCVKSSIEKARRLNIPIYSIKDWYGCKRYPIEEIINCFGTKNFSETIDYMIALAIYEGFSEIHLFGVNATDDHFWTKEGINFWCGVAIGKGLKIYIHGSRHSRILKPYNNKMYGYEYPVWSSDAKEEKRV